MFYAVKGEIILFPFQDEVNFSQLFVAPSFDELEQVATDSMGNLKRLSDEQLMSIWEKGYIAV